MVAIPRQIDAGAVPLSGARDLRVAVISDATPERNGVGSYYADLVHQLRRCIGEAELFCPEGAELSWHRYLAPPLPGDSTQRIWFPRPIKLWRRIRQLRPQAIIVPTPGPYGLFGLLVAKTLRIPLIVGFHTHYEALASIYWSDLFGRVCRWYLESCNRLLFRHASLVLANSPEMVRLADSLGAQSTQLMGTSVALEFLQRPLKPTNAAPRRILFAGRLAEEKNVPLVIDVARQRPDVEVSIAGDGPLRDAVERATVELPNLEFLGWVPREDLIDVIDDHDILLLPSQVESFGTVALEGMARARPVIVSGSCGIAEWPELEEGLFCIQPEEDVVDAVDRVRWLSAEVRQARASKAHEAAQALNAWNLETWIRRIGLPGRDTAAGESSA